MNACNHATFETQEHLPRTVAASLEARLAPFHVAGHRSTLEDLDVEVSQAVSPRDERVQKLSLL